MFNVTRFVSHFRGQQVMRRTTFRLGTDSYKTWRARLEQLSELLDDKGRSLCELQLSILQPHC